MVNRDELLLLTSSFLTGLLIGFGFGVLSTYLYIRRTGPQRPTIQPIDEEANESTQPLHGVAHVTEGTTDQTASLNADPDSADAVTARASAMEADISATLDQWGHHNPHTAIHRPTVGRERVPSFGGGANTGPHSPGTQAEQPDHSSSTINTARELTRKPSKRLSGTSTLSTKWTQA